jgi:hypothetical protein
MRVKKIPGFRFIEMANHPLGKISRLPQPGPVPGDFLKLDISLCEEGIIVQKGRNAGLSVLIGMVIMKNSLSFEFFLYKVHGVNGHLPVFFQAQGCECLA